MLGDTKIQKMKPTKKPTIVIKIPVENFNLFLKKEIKNINIRIIGEKNDVTTNIF